MSRRNPDDLHAIPGVDDHSPPPQDDRTPIDDLADAILSNPEKAAPLLEAAQRAASLELELAQARAELHRTNRELALTRQQAHLSALRARCVRDTISASEIHPDELDLVIGSSPHQLLSNLRSLLGEDKSPFPGGSLCLIPVRLWPLAIQPSPDGSTGVRGKPTYTVGERTLPNLILGQTSVNQTWCTHRCISQGSVREVSLTAYATVQVNTLATAEEVIDRLTRTSQRQKFQITGVGDARSESTDSRNRDIDSGDHTFIPSLQTTQRESSPTHNP